MLRAELKDTLKSAVANVLKRDNPRQPGVFKVKIAEIKLDPKLFKDGRTVDIQAQVRKLDTQGNTTLSGRASRTGRTSPSWARTN